MKIKSGVRAAKNKLQVLIVSPDLFRTFDAEKALDRKLATHLNLFVPSFAIELSYCDFDVFVGFDMALDGFEFKILSNLEEIMTKKTTSPMNPVIPASTESDFLHIQLTHTLKLGIPKDGCTGVKSTCSRKTAPYCKACLKL